MWNELFPNLSFPIDSYPYAAWQTRPVAPSGGEERAELEEGGFLTTLSPLPRLSAYALPYALAAGGFPLPGHYAEHNDV